MNKRQQTDKKIIMEQQQRKNVPLCALEETTTTKKTDNAGHNKLFLNSSSSKMTYLPCRSMRSKSHMNQINFIGQDFKCCDTHKLVDVGAQLYHHHQPWGNHNKCMWKTWHCWETMNQHHFKREANFCNSFSLISTILLFYFWFCNAIP